MNTCKLQKIRNGLRVAVIGLASLIAGVFMYARFFEKPPLSYVALPFPIEAVGPIYPGGVATATATRCNSNSTKLTYRTTRQLIRENSNQPPVVLPSVEISAEPGCSPVSTKANVVPDDTLPGWYRFKGTALPKGLIYEHEVDWNTDVFLVVAKPPSPPVATSTPLVLPIANATVKIEVKK